MSITHVTSNAHLDSILAKAKDKVSVIDFHASWCGPCHAIAPTFEALSRQYPNVNFIKCDVDAAQDVAGKYSVTAMPTFIFLKGTSKVDQVRGANKAGLEEALRKHAGSSSQSKQSAFSGSGHTLGGSKASGSPTAPFSDVSPQVMTLLLLVGAYAFF
ncbi:thioredoxin-like protein, partial [Amylostereum chailletii]